MSKIEEWKTDSKWDHEELIIDLIALIFGIVIVLSLLSATINKELNECPTTISEQTK